MIINNVPQQCFLLLSNDEEKIALIGLEQGSNDITEQIKKAIKEHFALDSVEIGEDSYEYCHGLSFNFSAMLFEDGEFWGDLFTLEHLEIY